MGRRVEFYPLAEADLTNIYNYIAKQSGAMRAESYFRRIERLCLSLAEFPERGHPRADLAPGLRTLAMDRRVLIAFVVTADMVAILRVLYGGRSLSSVDLSTLH